MFKKLLIANRGAIACRIERTLRAMGVQSIAVYSDADAGSLHVAQADKAYCLGDGAANNTYLATDKLLDAARATPAPTRSIPATASCRRMPPSRRPAWPPASPSSGPRPSSCGFSA